MGSHIGFQQRGYYVFDADFRALAALLIGERRQLAADVTVRPNVDRLLEWLEDHLMWAGPGCIEPKLDEFLVTSADVTFLQSLLDRAEARVRNFGELVPAEYLNQWGPGWTNFTGARDLARDLDGINKLRQLLA
jgi:hypothetical protein